MNSICLKVSVPFCSFRKPYARQFLETERVTPPATVYGFLLSLVGEENRSTYIGTNLAIGLLKRISVSTILRTKWRVKTKKLGPGIGNNRTLDYQEILNDLHIVIWVAVSPLSDKIETAINNPSQINRFGGLSLGESRDLVDDVRVCENLEVRGSWLINDPMGRYPLPVWVDHVGSQQTCWGHFSLVDDVLHEPPRDDKRWITIGPQS